VLPPFRFSEPSDDMGTLWIQLAGLVKCGDRFVKLSLCQVRVPVRKGIKR
jgi:hypothetical protein